MRDAVKYCPKCRENKSVLDFGFNRSTPDGLQGQCDQCRKQYRKNNKALISERNKARYKLNPSKWIKRTSEYRKRHPGIRAVEYARYRNKQLSSHKEYYKSNRIRILERVSKYQSTHKELISNYKAGWMRRKRVDPHFRILCQLRGRIHSAVHSKGFKKSARTRDMLGCTLAEFQTYISNQFRDGMSWNNYGKHWHLDHKKPCSKFDLTKFTEQAECFHFTNLQPLLWQENLSKWAHYPHPLCGAL